MYSGVLCRTTTFFYSNLWINVNPHVAFEKMKKNFSPEELNVTHTLFFCGVIRAFFKLNVCQK